LSALPFIQAAGASAVVADVAAARLEACVRLNPQVTVLDARDDLQAQLQQKLGGELPTVVIDATGNAASMSRCFELVAHGGRIVFLGLFQGDVTFNDPNFHRRELTLLASRNAVPGDFTRIIGLMERGEIDTTPWITHRAPAEEFLNALPGWLSPEARVLKAMLEF
jgi:threonine dehydrogenase-like Zn-dependent dehydrogenase